MAREEGEASPPPQRDVERRTGLKTRHNKGPTEEVSLFG
jgi:hypothetical protein